MSLHLYDAAGNAIATLIDNEWRGADRYEFGYSPSIPSGVYFLRLMTKAGLSTHKITILK